MRVIFETRRGFDRRGVSACVLAHSLLESNTLHTLEIYYRRTERCRIFSRKGHFYSVYKFSKRGLRPEFWKAGRLPHWPSFTGDAVVPGPEAPEPSAH